MDTCVCDSTNCANPLQQVILKANVDQSDPIHPELWPMIATFDGLSAKIHRIIITHATSGPGIKAARLNLLHSILGRFGFTPADRSKINVPTTKPINKFDDW